ncbi:MULTISPECIES: heat-inducible transcriptional repressor HrcA [Paenibacillus]|uniref:Heat-inducible transcription repressor HrcA n=1 Tax=Paenibacillus whitsoniae TaxID=2496558 RepID=A0A430JBV2_9BACL|nr:heat-inducible transcriptional repressor HrcA [Paenibacillus whitsoniae]RTE08504.1 heat-inducible transcriptional repressor HrcA [Paenibacillus whitsoniae]
MLTERQRMILSAIIDDYVRSAEPIGSRSISKRGNVGFSPATIRNEMSDLEEMGFLEQPHTSAGRIPSHKGYRYYVDHLLQHGTLQTQDLDSMKGAFANRIQEMEGVIQHVAGILSSMTNYTSIVLGPEVFSTTLKHLQIVPLSETTAVAILVMNTGHVENKTITIPEGIAMSEIEKVVNLLNTRLHNVPLIHFKSKLYNEISQELSKYVTGYQELLGVIEGVMQSNEKDRLFLSGMTNMLKQPEFKDVEKVKSIFDLLEEAPTLIKLISPSNEGIEIKIGTENSLEAISNCSLITASYSHNGTPLGTIGILGPTRMEYGRVITLMDYLSRHLEGVLGRWYGK